MSGRVAPSAPMVDEAGWRPGVASRGYGADSAEHAVEVNTDDILVLGHQTLISTPTATFPQHSYIYATTEDALSQFSQLIRYFWDNSRSRRFVRYLLAQPTSHSVPPSPPWQYLEHVLIPAAHL